MSPATVLWAVLVVWSVIVIAGSIALAVGGILDRRDVRQTRRRWALDRGTGPMVRLVDPPYDQDQDDVA